jgi:hypothetical protein
MCQVVLPALTCVMVLIAGLVVSTAALAAGRYNGQRDTPDSRHQG